METLPPVSLRVAVAGAGGLTGREILRALSRHPRCGEIIKLIRRTGAPSHDAKVREHLVDYDRPETLGIPADVVLCAIGTTLKAAGSIAAQRVVDLDYPVRLAQAMRAAGARSFGFVSSVGAARGASNPYLRMKGETEAKLTASRLPSLSIIRPSFLLGERGEVRVGEKVGIGVARLLGPLFLGPFRKYRGVPAATVARALIAAAFEARAGTRIIESPEIETLGGE